MNYSETMHKIIKLELERHELYKRAARGELSAVQRERIPTITNELTLAWDSHRREDATRRNGPRKQPAIKRDTSAA